MPFYRAVMSLARFEQLCRFIHFVDSAIRQSRLQSDKFAPFRYFWTLFIMNMQQPYQASKEYTVDAQLLSTRNRCSFRQYIPPKPGKHGIKIFWLVDAQTNYPLAGEVYLGAQPNAERSKGIAYDLVFRLLRFYFNVGASLTMDIFLLVSN